MNRELWIKDIIGKVLESEGFSYIGRELQPKEFFYIGEGTSRFQRKVKNSKGETIKQTVSLQDHRYCKEIFLNFYSTAAGHILYRIDDFVPDCNSDGLYFETEEEYQKAIEQFANILVEYGLPFLEKIKEPILKYYLTDKDEETLFFEHEKLVNQMIEREKIKIEELDVEGVIEYIERKIEEEKEKPFEEVKRLLLELSALFGAVVNQYYSCQWYLKENCGCLLKFLNSQNDKDTMCILSKLYRKWKNVRPEEERKEENERLLRWKKKKIKKEEKDDNPKHLFMNLGETVLPTLKEELLKEYKLCTQSSKDY